MKEKNNKIMRIDETYHNAVYKWVKSEFLRAQTPSSPFFENYFIEMKKKIKTNKQQQNNKAKKINYTSVYNIIYLE